jgi:hypothetical protein
MADEPPEGERRLQFDYLKSSLFRVVHADGVVGGLTPRLDIIMNFWSERQPIPRTMIFLLKEDDTLGEEVRSERVSRDAIVREVEAGVVMDLESAKSLRDWLDSKINEAERIVLSRSEKKES